MCRDIALISKKTKKGFTQNSIKTYGVLAIEFSLSTVHELKAKPAFDPINKI